MAILITQARFAPDGLGGVLATPEGRLEAAGRLIAQVGGKLLGCYFTSGDYDLLLIFEVSSYERTVKALTAAAAGSGVTDLKTVNALTPSEMKRAFAAPQSAAADHRSAAVHAADPAATGAGADQPTANPPSDGTAPAEQEDAEAAARILDARRKATEDIAAGRPAPYYFAPPPTGTPPQPVPASSTDDERSEEGDSPTSKTRPKRIPRA
jgi:uncharacterized protein with GYD domain